MKIIESKIAPNPKEAQYWIDLSADANRNVIKSFNGHEWVVINGGVNNSTPYVTFDYTQYSDGDTLSNEDAEKLSKAITERIPISIISELDNSRYNVTVRDDFDNRYSLLFLLSILEGSNGVTIRFGQINLDMNTNTVVAVKVISK